MMATRDIWYTIKSIHVLCFSIYFESLCEWVRSTAEEQEEAVWNMEISLSTLNLLHSPEGSLGLVAQLSMN